MTVRERGRRPPCASDHAKRAEQRGAAPFAPQASAPSSLRWPPQRTGALLRRSPLLMSFLPRSTIVQPMRRGPSRYYCFLTGTGTHSRFTLWRCLSYVSLSGHTDTVHALVKAGADANSGVHIGPVGPLIAQYTPLGRACRNGHTETMLVLLEAGADPNVGLSLGPFGTIGTYSLLGHAAAHGNTEAVRALLKAGADANQGLCFGPLGALASFSPLEHAGAPAHAHLDSAAVALSHSPTASSAHVSACSALRPPLTSPLPRSAQRAHRVRQGAPRERSGSRQGVRRRALWCAHTPPLSDLAPP